MSELNMVCLDLEGVLCPEIWIAFSRAAGIPELSRTTRDEPDYDKLMKYRMAILNEKGLGLPDIQRVIGGIEPMEGAREFLDDLRERTQVLIISDTFTQFARPIMEKLGWPTLMCNALVTDEKGRIVDYRIRVKQSKLTTVRGLQNMGFDTIACGDSYNDLGMIRESKAGFLFRTTEKIARDNPDIEAFERYDDLLKAIEKAL